MKIHQKLNLGFLSILGPIILISLLAVWLIEDRLDRLSDFHSSTLFSIQVISSGTGNAIQESFAYVISGDTHEKEEFLLWQAEIAGQLEAFKRTAALGESGEEAEKALIDRIESGVSLIIDGARNMFDSYESTGSVDAEVFKRYEAAIDQTFQALDKLIGIERTEVTDSQEAAIAVISLSENIVMVMLIIGLVLAFVSARVLTRFISRPLTQLRTASQALAQGDLDWKLEAASKDELGDLTHSFRDMAEQLKKSRDELEEQVRSRTLELQTTVKKLQEEVVVRKRAEEALRTTQQYLDTILLNLPVGIAILEGPDFRYYRINQRLAEMNGLSVEDHLDRPLAAVLPEAAPDIIPGLRHVLETGEPRLNREFSTRLPKDPEVIRHLIDSFFPIKGADGKPRAVGAVVLDITARKQAEEALQRAYAELEQRVQERTAELTQSNARLRESKEVLRKAEAKFRGLMESAPDGMILVNEAGEMMHVNVQAERLFGYKQEELTGQPCEMLIPERFSLHGRLRNAYLADPKQRPMDIGLELFGLRKDGCEFPVEISLTPLHTEEGLIVSCAIRDITEHKQAEEERARLFEEIIAANNRLEQMSHRLVAHQEEERRRLARELHDEVGGLLSSLQLSIKMPPASEEAARQHTQMASQLIDSLIEQIRTLSLRLRPHVLDDLGLVPALRWLIKRYRQQTRIEVVFQHEIPDDTRFSPEFETTAYRIIQEALTNVARHAEVDTVQVLLLREGDRLVIHVIDEGQGFEVEIVRARQDSMGLSGMEERAALLGGTLTLDTAPGTGTKVTATLPLD